MTKQRKLVYQIVQEHPHITAEDIYLIAKEAMPSIAMGTVYRNLGIMAENGEILRTNVVGAPDRYDKTVRAHDHAICVKCGKMIDIPEIGIKDTLRNKFHEQIVSYNLQVFYKCEDCCNKKQKTNGGKNGTN